MKKQLVATAALAGVICFSAGATWAMDQEQARETVQTQERIYGSQLMSEQERTEYRARMRAAQSAEEREQIRSEHHEQMKKRAREQSITLPDEPPAMGGGMNQPGSGTGYGSGGGMGRGSGMGGGGRRR